MRLTFNKGQNQVNPRGVMSNTVWSIIIFAGGLYVVLCAYLFMMQDRLIFYPDMPTRQLGADPSDINLAFEQVTITTEDEVALHGWFVPAEQEKGVVLFFHGNAGNISHRLDTLKILNGLGLSTLIIDYRGFGQSTGEISEQGTYLDAEAAWKYLIGTKNVPAGRIIVFGRSLGAAIAAYIASVNNPAGLVVESAFTSVPDMAAKLYPLFPVKLLSRYQYNTRKKLTAVSCPVLIIHSPTDEIIPFENAEKLYKAAGEPKDLLEISGGHNEGFLISGEKYIEGLRDFLGKALSDNDT
jgi:fermentation-respiration switch protein FrsA (DUF1100 family)